MQVDNEEPNSEPAKPILERIAFGWWNTSLSPVGKDRSDENHKEIARTVVTSLMDDLGIDCLGLGEVTNADLSSMLAACKSDSLRIHEGTLKDGNLQFDTGVIYNQSRLAVANFRSKTSRHGGRRLKISNRIDFVSLYDGLPIHVFVSHWPSRSINEENILSRKTVAGRIKDQLDEISEITPNAAMVVMGDFNDEPFDESISWHLLATRDRNLAQTKSGYLYNPFWRQLGESEPYGRLLQRGGTAGTCFYKGTTETHWRTFDQILFSAAFLGKSEWHLNEDETRVIRSELLIRMVENEKVNFDHLPVFSVVERISRQP